MFISLLTGQELKVYCLGFIPVLAAKKPDLLFRRFIGLSISKSAPDLSTLWRFRSAKTGTSNEVLYENLAAKIFDCSDLRTGYFYTCFYRQPHFNL